MNLKVVIEHVKSSMGNDASVQWVPNKYNFKIEKMKFKIETNLKREFRMNLMMTMEVRMEEMMKYEFGNVMMTMEVRAEEMMTIDGMKKNV